ncbi:hypothetical protein GGR57DRAFT_264768 [Xylariaceae sp. FL1272]|nr:hypothetical protein GGR57DRAFT_264768 [Xylariaceae sp. FL1272]
MAARVIIRERPRLESLRGALVGDTTEFGVNVVVVPDIGSPHESHAWSDGKAGCWLNSSLPQVLDRPYVLEFAYGSPGGTEFSWERLVHCGDILLEQLVSQTSYEKRPLIFICHGLGGVLVKRAVSVLYSQFWEVSFERLRLIFSGIVFLGTPHPRAERASDLVKLNYLLRASTDLSKKEIERNGGLVGLVATVSEVFSNTSTRVPVLSTYEKKPTKIGRALMPRKREIIVNESIATIGTPREELFGVDLTHHNICHLLPETEFSHILGNFLRAAQDFAKPLDIAPLPQGPRSFAGWTGTTPDREESGPPVADISHLAAFKSSRLSSFEIIELKDATAPKETAVAQSNTLNLPMYLFKPHFPSPDFEGRDDVINVLIEALQPMDRASKGVNPSEPKTFALCGVGGLGKTQLAVEYAYRSKADFDAIFFLQASDTSKLVQGFAEISLALGLETQGASGDQVVTKDVVLGWLSQPTRFRERKITQAEKDDENEPTWLIIFDNADDLSVLRDFWPVVGNGSILVTSRDPLAKTRTHLSVKRGLDVEPLKRTEAGALLRRLTGYARSTDVGPSEEIADKLSGLPLAIHQIAGTINRRLISLKEFQDLWNREALRTDFYKQDSGLQPKTVWTVWAFEDLSQPALSLLNLIAFMDPDQIPEGLLNQDKDKDVVQGMTVIDQFPRDEIDFINARTELSKSSLVRRNVDRKELIIHRIIQDTTRLRMGRDRLCLTFRGAVDLLQVSWPFGEFNHSTVRWLVCEPLVPHIAHIHTLFNESDTLQNETGAWPGLAFLFMELGWYYIERGNLSESLQVLKTAEHICSLAPKECALTAGDVHGCLYYIAIVTNDAQSAVSHCRTKIAIFNKLGENDWRLAQGHSELAESYNAAGLYEEAIREADIAIEKYSNCKIPEYADWAQMNKGRALGSLGRLDEATKVLESYLHHREREFGPMDTESHK